MKREIKRQLDGEQISLFRSLLVKIEKEDDELTTHCRIARNLACSEWNVSLLGGIEPTKFCPELAKLLNKNEELLREEISRRRYFLLKAFFPKAVIVSAGKIKSGHPSIYFTKKQIDCYQYWEEELAKSNPNLTDRFADLKKT